MRILTFIGLFCGMVLSSQVANAQMRGWELGGWAGVSNYFGDLNTNWRINRLHLAGGAGARYNMNDRLAFRLGANAGKISAYDSDSDNFFEQQRNLSFHSLVIDGTAQFEFNFLPYVHGSRDYFYSPYMFVGTTFFYFNPKADLDGETYNLREMGTEGQFRGEEYNTTQWALAYGIGFKVDLSYRWSVNVELSARKLFITTLMMYMAFMPTSGTSKPKGRYSRCSGWPVPARSTNWRAWSPTRQWQNTDAYVFLGVGLNYHFERFAAQASSASVMAAQDSLLCSPYIQIF
ncbi:MAG: DUF6089 family protein [Saprospiraceae bacterium]